MRVARSRSALALCASVVPILIATLTPFGHADASAGSSGIAWCLTCRPQFVTDAVANVLLFIPFGAAFAALFGRARRGTVRYGLLAGAVLSLAVELLQLAGVAGGRDPTLLDLLCNSAGAALGAWLAVALPSLVAPDPRRAAWLATLWTAGACLTLAATAWSLGFPGVRATATATATATAIGDGWRRSDFPATPGHGWFAGRVSDAVVNDMPFPHRGTGPVIVQVPDVRRFAVRLTTRGADRRGNVVPMLYAHTAGDSLARVLVGTRGDALVLRSTRRTASLGLASPDLALRGVYADAATDSTALAVSARVTTGELFLGVRGSGVARGARLALTPTLGWAMLQRFIGATAPAHALLTAVWILLLVAPAAYWAWWSDRHRATSAIVGAAVLALALYVLPRAFTLSVVPSWQWTVAGGAFAAGLLAGAWSLARHDARVTRDLAAHHARATRGAEA